MKRLHTPANDNSTEQRAFRDPDGEWNLLSHIAHFAGISMVEADKLMRETQERHRRSYGPRNEK